MPELYKFDKSQELHSIPVLIGKKNALQLSYFLHFISVIALVYAGILEEFGKWYWIGISIFSILLIGDLAPQVDALKVEKS